MSEAQNLVGTTLGSYRLLQRLGVGGMGAVYLGEHQSIGKRAAIKVLHREIAANQDVVQRFFNEARAVNQIGHPGIIDIFDFGHDDAVGAYLVMDLLEGEPLADRLVRVGRLELQPAARVVLRIAAALQAAHDAGIVHRDLKPDNVFLVPDPDNPGEERVVLLDFGIAKLAPAAKTGGEQRTQKGMLLGTPRYMSPEQCHGAKALDHRTDVYALGVLAYELFCGRPPFLHDGLGRLMSAHMLEAPPSPREYLPSMPPALEAALLRALEKKPEDRQSSVAELGNAVALAAGLQHPSLVVGTEARAPGGGAPATADPLAPTGLARPDGSAVAGANAANLATGPALPKTAYAPTGPPLPQTLATPEPQLGDAGDDKKGKAALFGGLFIVLIAFVGVGARYLFMSGESAKTPAATEDKIHKTAASAGTAATAGTSQGTAQTPEATPNKPTKASDATLCEGGDAAACFRHALYVRQHKTPAKRLAAKKLLVRSCKGGHAPACMWLATAALPNMQQAALLYRRACELGSAPACHNIGVLYSKGQGVERSKSKAREMLRRACKGGHKPACGITL